MTSVELLEAEQFFYENLNATRYIELWETDLPPFMEEISLDLCQPMWFQQDDCLSHTSRPIRTQLNDMFPGWWCG